ncbi:hypothetical protein TYRP_013797 [Tyrophagus putrescentiae]|nr:hypothetical protein TYRP_013797 [Tyrophagus putrescentiae]
MTALSDEEVVAVEIEVEGTTVNGVRQSARLLLHVPSIGRNLDAAAAAAPVNIDITDAAKR